AEPLMAYLAQCAPERIPMTLVEGSLEDEVERIKALAALSEVSLLKHDPFEDDTPAVTVHRLVQAAARARSEINGSAQDVGARLIARLAALYPDDKEDPQSWPLCAQLTPHLLLRRDACPGDDVPVFAVLLNSAGVYFSARGAYSQAVPILRDVLTITENARGPEHPRTARALNNLGYVLQAQADLAGARPLCQRGLAIAEKVLGREHPNTATSLDNLACLLQKQGELAGAQPLFERALTIREEVLGPEHPDTATSLVNLAYLLE